VYINICVSMYNYMSVFIGVGICVCMIMLVCVCVNVCTCVFMFTCVRLVAWYSITDPFGEIRTCYRRFRFVPVMGPIH